MILLRWRNKDGQIASFLILVAAVLILTIPATMLLGEAAFQRIRIANVADSAVISVASAFCRSLNQIKQISFGPGGLMVTYVGLQTFLLAKRTRCSCRCSPGAGIMWIGVWSWPGEPLATGFFINSMLTSRRLFKEAEKIAKRMPRDLHVNLWDRALGGALVDEPKPFIDLPYGNPRLEYNSVDSTTWDEIERNPEPEGNIAYINYEKYINRDSQYTRLYRKYKKENPATWYNEKTYSYTYSKNKDGVVPEGTPLGETTGKLIPGEPDCVECEAYFRAETENLPNSVSPEPQNMALLYFWLLPIDIYTQFGCYGFCIPIPSAIPDPYAWIKRIDIDSTQFSLGLRKLVSFKHFPFFGARPRQQPDQEPPPREPTFTQNSTIRLQGSVWSGYEPKLVK